MNVPGPTSFEYLRTVNGTIHDTYRSACQALNLLENDQHWDNCINDACETSTPSQIRALFGIILTTCSPSASTELWEIYKSIMSEDMLHRKQLETSDMTFDFISEIYNYTLVSIEDLCVRMANKPLQDLGMASPNRIAAVSTCVELDREQSYSTSDLLSYVQNNISKLTSEQKDIYDTIMHCVDHNVGENFFLDAPRGTGKTFVIKLILASIRSKSDIALAIASSGIAATLLPGGRTAHSALKLPLNLHSTETPTCNISKSSGMGKVLLQCKLIIWDECTMAHKKSLEALDQCLKDLRGKSTPFGSTLILLAGDFRQTLKLPVDSISGRIQLPADFCNLVTSKNELIEKVFPNILKNYKNNKWLSERAILAPKNIDVHEINNIVLTKIRDQAVLYKSVDTVLEPNEAVNYPSEFLNSIDLSGFPPHVLQLKIGVPIILLRNINPPKLCNGTRLAVKKKQWKT